MVKLDTTCGASITVNPGYLGRSALPEGLKALFRPMTVMVPDLVLICENLLMAEGYVEAKVLASKFYGLYSLLSELLSSLLPEAKFCYAAGERIAATAQARQSPKARPPVSVVQGNRSANERRKRAKSSCLPLQAHGS